MTMPLQIVPVKTLPLATAGVAAPQAHLTYHGGHLLQSVEVYTIFWGSAWQQSPRDELVMALNQFFDFILTSSLLDLLAEYSVPGQSIGHGRRTGTTTVTRSEPGDVVGTGREVTDAQIQEALQGWSADGTIPAPNDDTLYFVYLPPGVTSVLGTDRSCQVFCGYHNYAERVYYAVEPFVTCTGCTTGSEILSTLTEVSSHELCEAITDPGLDGWYDDSSGLEIGDICNFQVEQLGGYAVQREWSNQLGACVVAPANQGTGSGTVGS